jgi:spore coat protein H
MFKFFIYFLFILVLFGGCDSKSSVSQFPAIEAPSISGDIVDNSAWYSDMKDDVTTIRVTIPVPNDYECVPFDNRTAPSRPCTLEDIEGDTDPDDDYEPELHVKIEADDFIPGNDLMNASFEQKGKTTRLAEQKSFRIKLDSKVNLYNGERTLQLNKHAYDDSRVRNKLAFDLFRTIPNFTSLKTRFYNLFINNVDYGLFTHVEKAGKEYLINRGWNEDDNLYKAQNFDFRMSPAFNLNAEGKPIDPDAFNAKIEIERGKRQTKFVEMLNAINSAETDEQFEVVFNKYFNRENYITWLAVNIVTGNKDTVSQNFFLLNPLNSNTFYFLPWDYDGAGNTSEEYTKFELGIATWWDIPLHNKFFRIKKNLDDLDAKIIELNTTYITPDTMKARLDIYKPLVEPFINKDPDNALDHKKWEDEFNVLIPTLKVNIDGYESQKGHPMPFWQIVEYDDTNDTLTLKWDESIDLEGDPIVYDISFADNVDFNNSIVDESALSTDGTKLDITSWGEVSYTKHVHLSPGTYYMRVISKERDDYTHYQIAFDRDVYVNDRFYFGLLEFTLK